MDGTDNGGLGALNRRYLEVCTCSSRTLGSRRTSSTPAPTAARSSGVPATGRAVSLQEFAAYRIEAGLIGEVWVVADNLALLPRLR